MTKKHVVKVKRSAFHAVFVEVKSLDEIKKILAERRRQLPKARHHCWACRIRNSSGQLVEQARDDGEVGRPGHALLDLLRHDDLEGCVVVSRIYGGVKLGAGGVTRAVREAAKSALS